MGRGKCCRTVKITVTAPKTLKDEIEKLCKNSMNYATISDYTAVAIRYFLQQFFYDITPSIREELIKRASTQDEMELLEFDTDYQGDNESWQATVPIGTILQINSLMNLFPQLKDTNLIRFSTEYYLERVGRKEYIHTKFLKGEFDIDYSLPEIKFKPLKEKN